MEIILNICFIVVCAVYLVILLKLMKESKNLRIELDDLKLKQKKQFYYNKTKKNIV